MRADSSTRLVWHQISAPLFKLNLSVPVSSAINNNNTTSQGCRENEMS